MKFLDLVSSSTTTIPTQTLERQPDEDDIEYATRVIYSYIDLSTPYVVNHVPVDIYRIDHDKLIKPIILHNPCAFLPLAETLLYILFSVLERQETGTLKPNDRQQGNRFAQHTTAIVRVLCEIYTPEMILELYNNHFSPESLSSLFLYFWSNEQITDTKLFLGVLHKYVWVDGHKIPDDQPHPDVLPYWYGYLSFQIQQCNNALDIVYNPPERQQQQQQQPPPPPQQDQQQQQQPLKEYQTTGRHHTSYNPNEFHILSPINTTTTDDPIIFYQRAPPVDRWGRSVQYYDEDLVKSHPLVIAVNIITSKLNYFTHNNSSTNYTQIFGTGFVLDYHILIALFSLCQRLTHFITTYPTAYISMHIAGQMANIFNAFYYFVRNLDTYTQHPLSIYDYSAFNNLMIHHDSQNSFHDNNNNNNIEYDDYVDYLNYHQSIINDRDTTLLMSPDFINNGQFLSATATSNTKSYWEILLNDIITFFSEIETTNWRVLGSRDTSIPFKWSDSSRYYILLYRSARYMLTAQVSKDPVVTTTTTTTKTKGTKTKGTKTKGTKTGTKTKGATTKGATTTNNNKYNQSYHISPITCQLRLYSTTKLKCITAIDKMLKIPFSAQTEYEIEQYFERVGFCIIYFLLLYITKEPQEQDNIVPQQQQQQQQKQHSSSLSNTQDGIDIMSKYYSQDIEDSILLVIFDLLQQCRHSTLKDKSSSSSSSSSTTTTDTKTKKTFVVEKDWWYTECFLDVTQFSYCLHRFVSLHNNVSICESISTFLSNVSFTTKSMFNLQDINTKYYAIWDAVTVHIEQCQPPTELCVEDRHVYRDIRDWHFPQKPQPDRYPYHSRQDDPMKFYVPRQYCSGYLPFTREFQCAIQVLKSFIDHKRQYFTDYVQHLFACLFLTLPKQINTNNGGNHDDNTMTSLQQSSSSSSSSSTALTHRKQQQIALLRYIILDVIISIFNDIPFNLLVGANNANNDNNNNTNNIKKLKHITPITGHDNNIIKNTNLIDSILFVCNNYISFDLFDSSVYKSLTPSSSSSSLQEEDKEEDQYLIIENVNRSQEDANIDNAHKNSTTHTTTTTTSSSSPSLQEVSKSPCHDLYNLIDFKTTINLITILHHGIIDKLHNKQINYDQQQMEEKQEQEKKINQKNNDDQQQNVNNTKNDNNNTEDQSHHPFNSYYYYFHKYVLFHPLFHGAMKWLTQIVIPMMMPIVICNDNGNHNDNDDDNRDDGNNDNIIISTNNDQQQDPTSNANKNNKKKMVNKNCVLFKHILYLPHLLFTRYIIPIFAVHFDKSMITTSPQVSSTSIMGTLLHLYQLIELLLPYYNHIQQYCEHNQQQSELKEQLDDFVKVYANTQHPTKTTNVNDGEGNIIKKRMSMDIITTTTKPHILCSLLLQILDPILKIASTTTNNNKEQNIDDGDILTILQNISKRLKAEFRPYFTFRLLLPK